MIEYARKKLIWVRTTTNGSLLHLNDNYKKLVDTGVHDINISIDGATKDVYEAIRVGGKYEQIVENCRLINTYNNKGRKTIIRAWVVLQKKNKHQLLDFPAFFSGLGFKETLEIAKDYDMVAIFTSSAGYVQDLKPARMMKEERPDQTMVFVGPHADVLADKILKEVSWIDAVAALEVAIKMTLVKSTVRP